MKEKSDKREKEKKRTIKRENKKEKMGRLEEIIKEKKSCERYQEREEGKRRGR